ncbi:MAG: PAS domain-containing sensor histidine kinase [Pseudomonadota bacterium]
MRDTAIGPQFDPATAVSQETRPGAMKFFAVALSAAAFFACAATFFLLSPYAEQAPTSLVIGLLSANIAIAGVLTVLIGMRLYSLWRSRRHGFVGAKLQVRLVGLFSLLAVAPAIMVFAFSAVTLRVSFEELLGDRVSRAVETNRGLANAYVDAEAYALGQDMFFMAGDLQRIQSVGVSFETNPIGFRSYLARQAIARKMSAVYLLDGQRRIITRVELMPGPAYALPQAAVFAAVDAATEPGQRFHHSATDPETLRMFRGLLKVEGYEGGYLIAYKPIPPDISEKLVSTREVRDDFLATTRQRERLETVFAVGFAMLALIFLLAAIWLGLWAASGIVAPISRLVGAAGRVSEGDLSARVDVGRNDNEIGVLSRAFNRMTSQLQTQRSDLIEANRQFDRRRRFTEMVLSGVSAGVIGLDTDGKITIANKSAPLLLEVDEDALVGADLADVAPEFAPLISEAMARPHASTEGQLDILRGDHVRNLTVRVARDEFEPGRLSFVVTFDDITNLISAQRSAAWGDIARRIAHEIKNPLTPIQLSAERLRRKYRDEVQSNPDIFEKCTETIIRQVSDIRRMVDEFSSFARMPSAVMGQEELGELVRSAVFPQKVAAPDIAFKTNIPDAPVLADCDGRLLVQALTNIIKNATESISARIAAEDDDSADGGGEILVSLRRAGGRARIEVLDNGVGLPKAERHRLTEPYMTTRVKGTGLGLAIVKKVMEEHGGALMLEDRGAQGAQGARVTLTLPVADQDQETEKPETLEEGGGRPSAIGETV